MPKCDSEKSGEIITESLHLEINQRPGDRVGRVITFEEAELAVDGGLKGDLAGRRGHGGRGGRGSAWALEAGRGTEWMRAGPEEEEEEWSCFIYLFFI